jgi:TolB-like protein
MRYLGTCVFAVFLSLLPSRGAVAAEPPPATDATVLVLPFVVSDGSSNAWIGRAVQHDLEADLMRGTHLRVLAPSSVPATADSAESIQTAKRLGASLVVFGQMQSNATEVRLTGQIVDVTTEKPLGPMKATGLMADLFHLEDAIAGQAMSLLPKDLLNQQALQAAANNPQTSPAPQAQPSPQTAVTDLGPTTTYQSQTSSYPPSPDTTYVPPPTQSAYQYVPAGTDFYSGYVDVPSYTYGYACPVPVYTYPCYPYPDFGCTFPFFGFGVVIAPSFGFDHHHDFDHHHGFDGHHDFGHGFDHPDHGHGPDHGSFNHGFSNHPGGSSFVGGGRGPSVAGLSPRAFNGGAVAGPRSFGGVSSPVSRGAFAGAQFGSAPHVSTFSGGAFRGSAFRGGGISRPSFGGGFHSGGFHASAGGFHGGSGGFHGGGGHR